MIETLIIKSILDNDLYTLTVGQVAFQHFPGAVVKYQFINRGKTQFPEGFADELQNQLQMMKSLQLSKEEFQVLQPKVGEQVFVALRNVKVFSDDYSI